jgi:hypothetical protein
LKAERTEKGNWCSVVVVGVVVVVVVVLHVY